MCGIAGAIDLNGRREFSASRLLAMTGAIAHRGPDDEQIHVEPGVALGARRLSIVDLAGGRQPISNEDGSIWVTFRTASCSNIPSSSKNFKVAAIAWRPVATPSLWAHLYEEHGEGMFEKARGQFAVALWDRNTRTLILGRDRVGICPALLRPGRRLAALGLGNQGASGLGFGRSAAPTPRASTSSSTSSARARLARFSKGSSRSRQAITFASTTADSSSKSTGTWTSPTQARSAG